MRYIKATCVFATIAAGISTGILPAQIAQDLPVRIDGTISPRPLPGILASEMTAFLAGLQTFQEVETVSHGLGPGYNLDSCAGCHAQPFVGGTSPRINPQIAAATRNGANNRIPSFINAAGPVRVARFPLQPGTNVPDGGVHDLFTIAGRADAPGCSAKQPDFAAAMAANNVAFRIPTPIFGAGLIEAIPDNAILSNQSANAGIKQAMGISGHANTNGNDGTVTRFGWKAQNKSLMIFASEAYNVEMGVTNDLFPNERNDTPGCGSNGYPEDTLHPEAGQVLDSYSDSLKFTMFMRYLDQPLPAPDTPTIVRGRNQFTAVGCALCHTPFLMTGKAASAALTNKRVNLFSDLLVHYMGSALSDNITQGSAGPGEFRTAPLWGVGQRIFFLHDGRTVDLKEAIMLHRSLRPQIKPSEATTSIGAFEALSEPAKQDLLNFLRSL